jgi:hypothetical protein
MRNRNQFTTPFWDAAFKSLPPAERQRYKSQLRTAERWELAIGDAIELFSRGKKLLARAIHPAPRRRTAH